VIPAKNSFQFSVLSFQLLIETAQLKTENYKLKTVFVVNPHKLTVARHEC